MVFSKVSGTWCFPLGAGEKGKKVCLNSVCVVWPDYMNSLIKKDD